MDYGYSASAYARSLENYPELYSSSNLDGLIFAGIASFVGIILFVILVIAILQIVGMWKVYTKAGEKGWKSIIPFYNIAILYKISGMSPYLAFLLIGLFIPIINIFVVAVLSIIDLYQKINLIKAFKQTTGFTVAIIMVPFITYLVLGFGKSKYYGLEDNTVEATVE